MAACTESRLKKEAPETATKVDDKLRIKGRYCTERSGQVSFPVKVLYIVDQSASLQCTDSGQKRFSALRNSVDALRRQPNTEFAFIGFASWSRQVGFTRNRDDVAAFLDPNQGLGPATDYQGALATAIRILEEDMLEVGPAERARTRYQVVFVSDGVPEPRCLAGCEDDQDACTDTEDNDGDGRTDASDPDCDNIDDNSVHPDNLYGVCNTDQEIPDDVYVDMNGICPAYNQPPQIRRRIEELLSLSDTYSVGGVTLNTVLLFSPQSVVEQICPDAAAQFGYEKNQAEAMLRSMANQGNGTFRDVNLETEDDDFLRFDITSLKAEQTLTSMMATNTHARRAGEDFEPDTDHDGLSDAVERELGTDPQSADTDGDHYHDLFEHIFRAEGFDPVDAGRPALSCDDNDDRDQDGLNGCEESFLETSTLLPDTDGDDLLDFYEMRDGTDPTVADANSDLDFDGVDNADEIRGGTDPSEADKDVYRDQRIVYGLDDLGAMDIPRSNNPERTDERHCYDFDIRDISLVVTPVPRQRGLNRVLLYANERPARVGGVTGETRVACFEAYYDGGQVKSPASGVIDVSQDALDGVRERLATAFDDLNGCAYFGGGQSLADAGQADAGQPAPTPLDRDAIEGMVGACMPPKIGLEGRLYTQQQLLDMVESNLRGDLSPKLPDYAYELFVPIQNFRPDRDCFKPWEFDLLESFVDEMEDACAQCPPPEDNSTP